MHKGTMGESEKDNAVSFDFRYFLEEDKFEAITDISDILPGFATIKPFIGNIELGARVYPDDCRRAIDFFSGLKNTYHDSFCYIRMMDKNGEYPWFEVRVLKGRVSQEKAEGTISKINMNVTVPKDGDIDRVSFFGMLEARLNEMPLYDVANFMIIKLTEYDTLHMMDTEKAKKALEESREIIWGSLRDSDLITYVGGGIFFASLTGIKDEKILCDKAALMISTLKITWGIYTEGIRQTVAIGMSTVPHDSSLNIAEIYMKGAKALESAESSRKNTYMFFTNTMKKEEEFVGRNVSLHDIELVKTILNPIHTWAYAVDERFHLIYKNEALNERIPGECIGYCYDLIKGIKQQCVDCPLKKFDKDVSSVDSDIYSPGLRRIVHCRTTRLMMRNNIKVYIIAESRENISEHMSQLNESVENFNKAMLKTQDIIWDIDLMKNRCTRIREVNVLAMTERRVDNYENLRRYYLENVVCPEDKEDFLNASSPAYLREAAKIGRESVDTKIRLMYQDGTYHWYAFHTVFENDRVFLSAQDINELSHDIVKDYMTSRKYEQVRGLNEIQNELARNFERSEHVNELTGIYVFEYDVAQKNYYLSTTFDKMFKISDPALKDEWSLLESLEPYVDDREKFNDFLDRVKREPDTHEITLRLINKYDVALYFTITVQTLQGLNNRMARVTGCIQDVNTEMEIKAELEFRADYDSITGLYNSESFYRRTMERIFLKSSAEFAMIALDINRFRLINDRFGVEVGNNCLKELGKQISLSLPWDGIAGRYQADNFSILVEYEKDQDILDYIERLGMAFHFEEAVRCGSTLSFGIYKINDRDIPVRVMCDRARLAKHDIKGNTLTNFAVYDDRIRLQQIKLAEMESEMQVALDRHEFVMYLQPKVDLKTGEICGAEALVRWQHPIKGLRMPGDFLPLFENNGFIKKIDEYMWESAAIYLAKLKSMGLSIPISVNISRLHISNTDLIGELTGLVQRYDIEPGLLELEITETLFIEDTENLYNTMQQLKEKGFVIEMDDFGSGYSSLNMLKDAPVDVIKIDRFFIDEVIDTKRGKVIVANSIAMSKQLGLKVVAEGVENLEQVEFLKSVGCDIAQGYYYSKPIPQDEFEELLKR
ncbi:MAG: GGDEF domain-containing protein [Lachnospiraceae bacterium]|nr:GGDEF domain-containing protein [Lachnospiraceae bacterium]